jgi:uncharacterized protein (TIGR03435 family)
MRYALPALLLLAPLATYAQAAPAARPASAALTFEVASVHQSPEPDMRQLIAKLNAGIKPESIHIDGERAVFTFMSLKRLVAYAYNAQTYEVTGPDWLPTDRFDITATLPAGSTKEDVPRMMQTLLRDRFHMEARRTTLDDQPVLGIQTGKNGTKLKPAMAAPKALDLSQPLQPGQTILESPTGPILLTRKPDGATEYDMGDRGDLTLKFDTSSMAMQMTSNAITMNGVAVMINILGSGQGREVVNQTNLSGPYQVSLQFALGDLLGALHDDGIDLPPSPGYDDPDNGATLGGSLNALGLHLEKTRASVTRLVVDKIDKTPSEN